MDRKYYSEYYLIEREHWWFRARAKIIQGQIETSGFDYSNLKILNIGIATGASTILLQKYGTVKSIEFDYECYSFVKETLGLDIEQGSILNLPYPDNSFDLVCAFDVIEHVDDDQKGIDEMYRVCKNSGIILITVPANKFLWSNHDVVNQHYRRYSKNEVKQLFKNKGSNLFASYFNLTLFIPVTFVRMLQKTGLFNVSKKGSGSDFNLTTPNIVSKLLYKLMKSENWFLKKKICLPFGTSIILKIQKNKILKV
jgi:SAM-dependent methyltransferase